MSHPSDVPTIPSASSINLIEVVPTKIIFASAHAAPHGLYVRVFHHGSNVQLSAPAVSEELIHICLQGRTIVQGKVVRRFQPTPIEPGDFMIIPRGEATEWGWTAEIHFLQLCLSPQILANAALDVLDVDPARTRLVERIAGQDPLLREVSFALLAELRSGGRMGQVYTEALVHVLAAHLVSRYTERLRPIRRVRGSLPRERLRLVLDYIHAHLTEDLRLADIAAVAHISPFYFGRLFKQSMGRPVYQYVIEQRIEEAKRLLLTSRLSISEVATVVGFHDQSHFYRHFKRLVGITPKQIREGGTNVQ